jgi:hypothetical protein
MPLGSQGVQKRNGQRDFASLVGPADRHLGNRALVQLGARLPDLRLFLGLERSRPARPGPPRLSAIMRLSSEGRAAIT